MVMIDEKCATKYFLQFSDACSHAVFTKTKFLYMYYLLNFYFLLIINLCIRNQQLLWIYCITYIMT